MPNRIHKQTLNVVAKPIKLLDQVVFEDSASIVIKLVNLRSIRGKIACGFERVENDILSMNSETLNSPRYESSTTFHDITQAFNSPQAFLDNCNIKTHGKTKIQLELSVEEIAADAPQELKEFYNNKLTPAKLKEFLKAVNKTISQNISNTKIEDKVRDNFISQYFIRNNESQSRDLFNSIVIPVLMIGLGIGVIAASGALAALFNVSAMVFVGIAACGIIAAPFYGLMSYSKADKERAQVLSKLGVLEKEEINTPANKEKFCKRLSDLLTVHESYCKEGLEVGEKSYLSNFTKLISFFNTKTYNSAYYVGQEMAAKRSLQK